MVYSRYTVWQMCSIVLISAALNLPIGFFLGWSSGQVAVLAAFFGSMAFVVSYADKHQSSILLEDGFLRLWEGRLNVTGLMSLISAILIIGTAGVFLLNTMRWLGCMLITLSLSVSLGYEELCRRRRFKKIIAINEIESIETVPLGKTKRSYYLKLLGRKEYLPSGKSLAPALLELQRVLDKHNTRNAGYDDK